MRLELIAAAFVAGLVCGILAEWYLNDHLAGEVAKLRASFETFADAVAQAAKKEVHVTVTAQNAPPSLQDAPQPTAKPVRRVWPD